MKFGTQLVLSVSFALASVSTPALAAEHDAPKSVAVRYADLDLSHPDGASALYARIRAASREVCAAANTPGAARRAEWNTCRREALNRAVASLGIDAITQLHAAHSPRSTSTSAS